MFILGQEVQCNVQVCIACIHTRYMFAFTILGNACRTRVAKVLAKTFSTPQDAEVHFQGATGPGTARREILEITPEEIPDNVTQEREPPEGATFALVPFRAVMLSCRLLCFCCFIQKNLNPRRED